MYLISGRFANRAREGKLEVINDPGILLVNLDFRDFLISGADLGGGCRGCAPPLPPEMKLSSSDIRTRF